LLNGLEDLRIDADSPMMFSSRTSGQFARAVDVLGLDAAAVERPLDDQLKSSRLTGFVT